MGECRSCGKKGFFLHVNKKGLCESCEKKVQRQMLEQEQKIEKIKRENELMDEQIQRLNEARKKYEKEGNYDKLIMIYEEVFSQPCFYNAASQKLLLVKFYQKHGQDDKAWALLNSIALEYPNDIYRVRREQYRQLKREQKYSDALEMYFLFKINDCREIACWAENKDRETDLFQKEARTIAKKAKLDEQSITELTDIFIDIVEKPKISEVIALRKYREWYKKQA